MFDDRDILYFNPFFFKNGNRAKKKYFVVLKRLDDEALLAALPSSKDFVPSDADDQEGCIDLYASGFNCYLFAATTVITECGKRFPLKTYIYGHQIEEYMIQELNELYPMERGHYFRWGKMNRRVFEALIDCLRTSRVVKNKYRRKL